MFLKLLMFVPVSVFASALILSIHAGARVCEIARSQSTAHCLGEEGACPCFSALRTETGWALAAAPLVEDAAGGCGRSWPGPPSSPCTQLGSTEVASSPLPRPPGLTRLSGTAGGLWEQAEASSPTPGPLAKGSFLSP